MNINNSVWECLEHRSLQNPHESREDDQLYLGCAQHIRERLFALGLKLCSESTGRKASVWDTKLPCDFQNSGIGDIRDDQAYFCGQRAGLNAFEDGPAITSLAGAKNSDRERFHASMSAPSFSTRCDVE